MNGETVLDALCPGCGKTMGLYRLENGSRWCDWCGTSWLLRTSVRGRKEWEHWSANNVDYVKVPKGTLPVFQEFT